MGVVRSWRFGSHKKRKRKRRTMTQNPLEKLRVDMTDGIAEIVPVEGSKVGMGLGDVNFACPCCEATNRIDLPETECRNCGTTLKLFLGHGGCYPGHGQDRKADKD